MQALYARIESDFRERIASGVLRSGERLPSEAEIAQALGASRGTVQRAMLRLAEAGLIERAPGRGSFVADNPLTLPIDQRRAQFFEEDMASQGTQVTYRLIGLTRIRADAPLATALACQLHEDVLRLERQRLVENHVVCLEERHFAPALRPDFPASALETEATYRLVEHYLRRRIERLDVSLQACVADPALAQKLGIQPGRPVMLREHVFIGEAGTPLMAGRSYYAEPFAFRYTAHRPRS
jgi:GntR family transcriptional regulator